MDASIKSDGRDCVCCYGGRVVPNGGLVANDPVQGCRNADAASGIAPDGETSQSGAHGHAGARRRASRPPVGRQIPGVARRAPGIVLARGREGELCRLGLPEDHAAGLAQALDERAFALQSQACNLSKAMRIHTRHTQRQIAGELLTPVRSSEGWFEPFVVGAPVTA